MGSIPCQSYSVVSIHSTPIEEQAFKQTANDAIRTQLRLDSARYEGMIYFDSTSLRARGYSEEFIKICAD